MPTASKEKWPVELQIKRITSSPVGELELFFVTGVMNAAQAATLKEHLPVHSEMVAKKTLYVLATLVNRSQLKAAYDVFKPLAKEWRGQYYALTNKFVDECRPILESI